MNKDYDFPLVAVPRRYLVVERDFDSADCVSTLLRLSGNSVTNARTGAEAVALAAGFDPHAVVLDLGTPDLDAASTCRSLREQAGGPARLLVAITAPGTPDVLERHESDFDAQFGKPVAHEQLIARLERHLAAPEREPV